MGADLAHRRGSKADLMVAIWNMSIHRREEKRTADGRSSDGAHRHLIYGDFWWGDTLGNPGDGFVVFEASEEDWVGLSANARISDIELERVAIQPGGGRQV